MSSRQVLIYLFTHYFYKYLLMDIYFWFLIQYYYNLFCYSTFSIFGHQELFHVDSCVLWACPVLINELQYFVTFQHYKMSQAHLVFSLPSHFLKKSWFFLLRELYLETKICCQCACFYCIVTVPKPFQQTVLGSICIYTNTYLYFYICIYVGVNMRSY